ncbi:mycothiol synthase [Phycicoccus endophyticus]|uniref:Mycothiol acetyltransferase n=1 Tax=Phycicoccus endophyticus TaxID=1690220 RepID=A0A7G9R1V1_9MICO|nr:mycothiol synthase [Phycicoccus endophyticus]NHI18626.1 mycothiol synthase [Phycicoccus endophyticus]QNN49576.1 mycothiol synthase [Phycicoccus endophyticus]GGL37722.1 mycothiol acetyltransferase [Phycicoccus endophyticus]
MPLTERLGAVDEATAAKVRELWERAEAADGVAAVSEAFRLALGAQREGVAHLLRRDDAGQLVGYAQVADARSPQAVAELVVDPAARRQGHGAALLDAARGDGARSVWAHGDLAGARALAAAVGLRRSRELYRMTRPLTDADTADPALPEGYTVRGFEPGRDDEAWVRLNAAAFAGHPEQGRLTVEDLRERMAQPWFDPAGLLLVEHDGRLAAFHWTKVETGPADGTRPDSAPGAPRSGTGEVYVVGVDPAQQGRGLGAAVTGLGLAHLARRGLAEVELYVDGDNTAARRTYARYGFEDAAVDVQYS